MHSAARCNPFSKIGMPTYGTPLVTERQNSALTLARFRSDSETEQLIGLPKQDAYLFVYQLRILPPHDFWVDGKEGHTDAIPGSAITIFDLNARPRCKILGPFDSVHLRIPRAALDDIADEANAPRIGELRLPEGVRMSDPTVSKLIAGVMPAMVRPAKAWNLFVDHIVLALHIHLAITYGGLRDSERLKSGGLAPWQERRAKALLAANLSNEISLRQIARECGLSVSYFSRAFKATTGTTPHQWLQACRIERAKNLLLAPEQSLAEISFTCGFADQSHFTKVFTRFAGDTPGAWRRSRRFS